MKITFSKRSYVTLYFLQFEAMKYGANFQSQSTQDNGTRENEEKIKRRETICSQTYIQHDRNASIEITLRTSKELCLQQFSRHLHSQSLQVRPIPSSKPDHQVNGIQQFPSNYFIISFLDEPDIYQNSCCNHKVNLTIDSCYIITVIAAAKL